MILLSVTAQENSPYSRYGLGDMSPSTHVLNRGMASISAAYSNPVSINFTNPASYSSFLINRVAETGEVVSGRVILDAGINFDNRTLREPNRVDKFTSPNTYFSYLQLGVPLKRGWGLTFGLRPITKIGYRIQQFERLTVDSAVTQYRGEGGSFLANVGTGFAIKNFSAGVNFGYLFGKKDYASERTLLNDTVSYARGNFQTKASFGGIFLAGGVQQKFVLSKYTESKLEKDVLRIGVYGNLKTRLNAYKDFTRETFSRDLDNGYFRIDSVYTENEVKGKIEFPASFGAGFIYEKAADLNDNGFMLGFDYVSTKWSDYRFYGSTDLVQDSREFRLGFSTLPRIRPDRNYWKNVSLRAGLFSGTDYINVGEKLPVFGASAGVTLPILNLKDPKSRYRTQYTLVNLSFEFIRRGNNDTFLKENLFRISAGFSLTDNWFTKRKYN